MTKVSTLSIQVDSIHLDSAVGRLLELRRLRLGGYVCAANVHMCMLAYDDKEFANVVNRADMVVADGRPIFWAQRLLGEKGAEQVRGQDLMLSLCDIAAKKGLNIGLYGGADTQVLQQVVQELRLRFRELSITFSQVPPYRPLMEDESQTVCEEIEMSAVDFLFVGLGCPKQEIWMASNKEKLSCVALGVGAAFDFISGAKRKAPLWVRQVGMEWFFRLCCEPRRLWKRYLVQNPRFLFYFMLQLIRGER